MLWLWNQTISQIDSSSNTASISVVHVQPTPPCRAACKAWLMWVFIRSVRTFIILSSALPSLTSMFITGKDLILSINIFFFAVKHLNGSHWYLPVGKVCSRPRSQWGHRWRRHGAADPVRGAGHWRGDNRPPESSRSGPVRLQLRLSGGESVYINDKLELSIISMPILTFIMM